LVLTAYSALSPAIGLVVTVTDAMREHCRRFDISVEISGPRGFTVCGWRFVRREKYFAPDTSNIHRSPRQRFVTIAIRPS
jgi:hypothetical protein